MLDVDTLKNYVGKEHTNEINGLVAGCEQSKIADLRFKNPKVTLILSIFLGFIGIDRLYQGGIKMFACKLAMVVLTFGTWWLADIYFSKSTVEEANYNKLLSAVA